MGGGGRSFGGLGGFDDCGQEFDVFFAVGSDGLEAVVIKVAGLVEQFQPVVGFVGFFEGDIHLVGKVGFTFNLSFG